MPLYVDCYEYELNLPQTYNIANAKWSPNGDEILITSEVFKIELFPISYHFMILDTTLKNNLEEVFSFSSECFWFDNTACWLSDSTFIFNVEKRLDNSLRNNPKIIYKFNLSSRETTRIYEDEDYFYLRDAFAQNLLLIKTPENVFFAHVSPHSGGVMSLYKKSLKDSSEPVGLTPLHPDTLLPLSAVYSARFVSNNKVVYEKCVVKTPGGDMVRRLEIMDLANRSSQLLKEYKFSIEDSEGTGFEVSPSGEWLIYLPSYSFIISSLHPTDDTLRLLSVINPEIEKRLVLRRNYGDKKNFSYKRYKFWAVDWSRKGDKILCIGEERRTKERKLFIVKLPKHIN
ncbi:MAG: hypothetical protein E3J87_00845 [Candidatus Cloacimonadota bacterium]|nr:MAG: hypothetical protein E3J87_00845 [Candidatus Cloacimonadota bacterium]